ncbi:PREDICTED: desmoglein-3-like [Cyprinodon variegatus]|uniref:desmoglein-3-like n=1 Tax=Cyprinodon variegatus TaxID=28743 RepID=UPI000742736C|nr:PREDICTED: desmoglein-3-like [Cyprinodon variegatus]
MLRLSGLLLAVLLFAITAIAKYPEGSKDHQKIEIQLKVEDDNDNPPRFISSMKAELDKRSPKDMPIKVEPYNDHCPKLTTDLMSMCTSENKLIVNAEDEDAFPFGARFKFSIDPDGTQGRWQVKQHNEKAAIVQAMEDLWPGVYKLMFVVEDQQGKSCPQSQKLKVRVCVCKDGDVCMKQTAPPAKLGDAGICPLFLGLLLLLCEYH